MVVIKVKRNNFADKLFALGYDTRAVARDEREKKLANLVVNSKVYATLATTHIL